MSEAIELKHVLAGDTWRYAGSETPSGLYKIRIPAGTSAWRTSVVTWKSEQDAEAFMAMDSPPVHSSAVDMSNDTRLVLQRLAEGATVRTYGGPFSQTLGLCSSEIGGAWRADRERWLYLDVRFPEGRVYNWQSQIVVPEGAPAPAPDGTEARTLALVQQAGLVPALSTFGACSSDADLIDRALSSGVWAGLLELVRLSENRGTGG